MTPPNRIAAELIRAYVEDGEVSADTVGSAIEDPRLMGEVVVHLAVIAGEVLKLHTAGTGTSPSDVLDTLEELPAFE